MQNQTADFNIVPVCLSIAPSADGGELPPRVEQRYGQLHFTKVTRSDAGNYTCIASNSLQGEIRALVTLNVAGKPLIHFTETRSYERKGHASILVISPTLKVLVVSVHL